MQLIVRIALGTAVLAALGSPARADDRSEVSTSVFAEKRDGGKGGLLVIHPQALFGIDLGKFVTLDVAYSADAVSGATSSVYQADAVSQATKFSDTRHEGTFAFGFQGRRSRITFSGTFGTERDYLTREVGASASIDLPGRNTTVAIGGSHSMDEVCDKDNGTATPIESKALTGGDKCEKSSGVAGKDLPGVTVWKGVTIDTAQVTITQNLTPTMNLQVALFGQILEGFQSNPYRRVRLGPNAPQEHIPSTRARWSLSARVNRYLPKLHAAAQASARFYNDTWGVTSGDAELAYSQYLGDALLLRVHARVYQQSAATFFKDAFYYQTESSAGAYWTGDRELATSRNAMIGGKLTLISVAGDKPVWHLFDRLDFSAKADVLLLSLLPSDSLANNPMGIGGEFIYGNAFLDAVVLQLGLLGTY